MHIVWVIIKECTVGKILDFYAYNLFEYFVRAKNPLKWCCSICQVKLFIQKMVLFPQCGMNELHDFIIISSDLCLYLLKKVFLSCAGPTSASLDFPWTIRLLVARAPIMFYGSKSGHFAHCVFSWTFLS